MALLSLFCRLLSFCQVDPEVTFTHTQHAYSKPTQQNNLLGRYPTNNKPQQKQLNGAVQVTSAKGTAAEQGVSVGDRLVRVGDKDLASHLKVCLMSSLLLWFVVAVAVVRQH